MPRKRATSLTELQQITKPLFSDDGYKKGLALKLRATDIVIAPFSKSGTTWTQQIVHTLRTRGSIDFDDISRVVPWIETSTSLGLDLNAEQQAHPRAFKSHLPFDLIPKGGRYINILRDFGDAAVSLFNFYEGWFLEPGSVPVDEFVEAQLFRRDGYYRHLLSWWPNRSSPNTLFLTYEFMKESLPKAVAQIANFIDVDLDDELLEITLEHASLPFMLSHQHRFDDALMRKRSEEVCNLPEGSSSSKIHKGRIGARTELKKETLKKIDNVWRDQITPKLGFNNYNELLTELRNR